MTAPATANPLQPFLKWCDTLGITTKNARQTVLINSIKAMSHETVLFFLCGQDYIQNPTDLKGQGIETLFIGQGSPFEVNIGGPAVASFKQMFHGAGGAGYRTGGAGNYNLCTKAILLAVAGLGPTFLRDMAKGVTAASSGPSQVAAARIPIYLQDMRNHARRFWMSELSEIGL